MNRVETLDAPAFVGTQHDFRVAPRAERETHSLELLAKLTEVVELAVVDDRERPGVVLQRLVATVDIDDAEAPHAEYRTICGPDAQIIRASVTEAVDALVRVESEIDLSIAGDRYRSIDPAHDAPLKRTWGRLARRSEGARYG